jgi:hypothetical protein
MLRPQSNPNSRLKRVERRGGQSGGFFIFATPSFCSLSSLNASIALAPPTLPPQRHAHRTLSAIRGMRPIPRSTKEGQTVVDRERTGQRRRRRRGFSKFERNPDLRSSTHRRRSLGRRCIASIADCKDDEEKNCTRALGLFIPSPRENRLTSRSVDFVISSHSTQGRTSSKKSSRICSEQICRHFRLTRINHT